MRSISPDVGFRVGDATVGALAFTNYVVLVSSTVLGLQEQSGSAGR